MLNMKWHLRRLKWFVLDFEWHTFEYQTITSKSVFCQTPSWFSYCIYSNQHNIKHNIYRAIYFYTCIIIGKYKLFGKRYPNIKYPESCTMSHSTHRSSTLLTTWPSDITPQVERKKYEWMNVEKSDQSACVFPML